MLHKKELNALLFVTRLTFALKGNKWTIRPFTCKIRKQPQHVIDVIFEHVKFIDSCKYLGLTRFTHFNKKNWEYNLELLH